MDRQDQDDQALQQAIAQSLLDRDQSFGVTERPRKKPRTNNQDLQRPPEETKTLALPSPPNPPIPAASSTPPDNSLSKPPDPPAIAPEPGMELKTVIKNGWVTKVWA